MSFKDDLPDDATIRIIGVIGLIIFIGITMVNAAGKYNKEPDRSVVVPAGETRK